MTRHASGAAGPTLMSALALTVTAFALGATSCGRPAAAPAATAADSGYVSATGARLFYKSVGRGDPIVIVHGGPGMDHAYLFPGMVELARSHRLVFYDQRGGGRTQGEVTRETVNLDLFMRDISTLADSLRLGRFTILGHSFGGLLALHYAERHPGRLRTVVLMNTVEPGRKFTIAMNDLLARRRTPQDSAEMQAVMQSDAMRRRDTSAVNAMLRISFRMLFADRALADRLRLSLDPRTVGNMGPVAMNLVGSMGTYDFWPLAARVRVPTLILQGADDAMPVQMLRELQQAIPGAELVFIERAGHFPYVEQPAATFAAIRRFLSSQAAR